MRESVSRRELERVYAQLGQNARAELNRSARIPSVGPFHTRAGVYDQAGVVRALTTFQCHRSATLSPLVQKYRAGYADGPVIILEKALYHRRLLVGHYNRIHSNVVLHLEAHEQ
ncbi:uncharacterized protein METZ01_LOCUS59967 [marine metagenome]|uniref:Uncharacterized protein n=1 Tax=marine metagenome TaxID=408172 RepID=A0A381T0F3_9ZZZZ